jgi:hypothetical protein
MQQINSLWIGQNFSLLEMLTMKSFIDFGYEFHLWVYDKKLKDLCPGGVIIRDANEILPESTIFRYDGGGDCRGGSLGGFSDLFRYYLIYKIGGIYVDMDVTCLSKFELNDEYGFRPHSLVSAVANILKAPAGCSFLETCITLTEAAIDKTNNEWVKPVKIFANTVKEYNLEKYIFPNEYFGNDAAKDILDYKTQNYFLLKTKLPNYGIHWCKECSHGTWSFRDIYDWNYPKPLSLYYNLLYKHKLIS